MRTILPLLLAATLLAAIPAGAQQCTQADTVLTCWQRFVPPAPALVSLRRPELRSRQATRTTRRAWP